MPELKAAFDWLAEEPPRDQAGVAEVPGSLEALWGEVRDAIGHERFDRELGPVRAGRRFRADDDHAWVQTHGDKDESHPNLTLELSADELTLNLVGFYGGQFEKVRGWLHRRSGRTFLRAHPELEVVIFVRTAHAGKGQRVMWKGARSEELERLKSREEIFSTSMRLSTLAKQIEPGRQRLALHVRKRWDRQETEAMADAAELAALANDWIAALPTVQLGGEPREW